MSSWIYAQKRVQKNEAYTAKGWYSADSLKVMSKSSFSYLSIHLRLALVVVYIPLLRLLLLS